MLWHARLGHPGSTLMCRIIENSHRYLLKNQKILLFNEIVCTVCSEEKIIIRPSLSKSGQESPSFLQRIQGDIYGPIYPSSASFHYFSFDRCICTVVTCLFIVHAQCCIFKRACTNYKIKGTIFRLFN